MGKSVAIVDKSEEIGGVCVHTGTIPSKTFREAVLHLSGFNHHGFDGRTHRHCAWRERPCVDSTASRILGSALR
ncbi:hypothetical protein DYB32_001475 [Aphanomyces invadans]|uniref:Uncharacterized protein n=1 Tax=Aphanomyces invadans TaxID=157072 RepID=A0A3R6Z445_9STRA|nr:hypothetical protein DYB32_001475 [Aphanomyces invadans]